MGAPSLDDMDSDGNRKLILAPLKGKVQTEKRIGVGESGGKKGGAKTGAETSGAWPWVVGGTWLKESHRGS